MKKIFLIGAVFCTIVLGLVVYFFQGKYYSPQCLSQLIEEKKWEDLSSAVGYVAKYDKTLQNFEFLTTKYPNSAFSQAYLGSKKILAIEGTGLSFSTIFPILLFYHTTLSDEIDQKICFWPESRFGRELQYDPETKFFFIHLGIKEIPPLGIGAKKVVSKTILYNGESPKIFARGCSTSSLDHERDAMHAVNNLYGVIPSIAEMNHIDPVTKEHIFTIVTPLYNERSLLSVIEKKILNFEEKLGIAFDITAGLAAMHQQGFVHRDLGSRNYFVNIDKETKSVEAVVADLGRAMPMMEAKHVSVQGNTSYISPEGFFRKKMEREMYEKSDDFAVGTVLYALYFEENAPWKERRIFKKKKLDRHERHAIMEYWVRVGREKLALILSKNELGSREKAFINVIYEMTNIPSKRMSAKEAAVILGSLLKDSSEARKNALAVLDNSLVLENVP